MFATTGALLGPLLGTLLLLVDFRAAAVTAAGVFAVLTLAQLLVLPARKVPAPDTGVLGDWREAVGNRRFLAFSLAMVGMYGLQNQLYLLLPRAATDASGWGGSVGLLFLAGTVANLLFQLRITRTLKARGSRGAGSPPACASWASASCPRCSWRAPPPRTPCASCRCSPGPCCCTSA